MLRYILILVLKNNSKMKEDLYIEFIGAVNSCTLKFIDRSHEECYMSRRLSILSRSRFLKSIYVLLVSLLGFKLAQLIGHLASLKETDNNKIITLIFIAISLLSEVACACYIHQLKGSTIIMSSYLITLDWGNYSFAEKAAEINM